MGKRKTISDQLRQFVEKDGRSRRQICLAAGLDPTQLHRFLHGTGRMSNETLDKLAAALDLELKPRGK